MKSFQHRAAVDFRKAASPDSSLEHWGRHIKTQHESKLISTEKDWLDITTTSPPGLREGSLQQIAGGLLGH